MLTAPVFRPWRPIWDAALDQDGGQLERWRSWVGAEMAIVWDARLGGLHPAGPAATPTGAK